MNNRLRPEDKEILKEFVRFTKDGDKIWWTCNKCSHKSVGRPYRIMAHLLRERGKGVKPCEGMKIQRENLAKRLGRRLQPEDNNDGDHEKKDVNSEQMDTIHRDQFPLFDFAQPSSQQGGRDMGMGDPFPTTSQCNFDRMNDQHILPLQDGAGTDTSFTENAFGSAQLSSQRGSRYMRMGDPLPTPPLVNFDRMNDEYMPPLQDRVETNTLFSINEFASAQLPSPQEGANVGMGDPLPATPQFNFDHTNDQHMLPLQDEVRSDPSFTENSFGSARLFYPPGGRDTGMGDPSPTPSQVDFDRMNDEYMAPLQDGVGANTSFSENVFNSAQFSFPQEGTNIGMGDPLPTTPLADFDHMNDQHMLPLQDGFGADASFTKNASGSAQPSIPQKGRDIGVGDPLPTNQVNFDRTNDQCMLPLQDEVGTNTSFNENTSGSAQPSFLQGGGGGMSMGDPLPTPPQVNCDRMNDEYMPPLQDGVGTDALFSENAFGSAQLSSPQEVADVGMGGELSATPRANPDRLNDRHMVPLQDGVRTDTSIPENAFGVGTASTPSSADPTPCPPDFPSYLWDFYVKIDGENHASSRCPFALYKLCTLSTSIDEKDKEDRLDCLIAACREVRDYSTNAPDNIDPEQLQKKLYDIFYKSEYGILIRLVSRIYSTEKIMREEAEQEVLMLGTKRKREMNWWLGNAAHIKSEVINLDIDAMKAESPSDILSLLKRINEMKLAVQELIEMGNSLLNPAPNLFSWKPSFMYCRSHMQNQTPPGPFPQQV